MIIPTWQKKEVAKEKKNNFWDGIFYAVWTVLLFSVMI